MPSHHRSPARGLRRTYRAVAALEALENRQLMSSATAPDLAPTLAAPLTSAPAPAATDSSDVVAPLAATAAVNFPVYDGTDIPGKPDLSAYGIQPIDIVYYTQWTDETSIRKLARLSANAGHILVFDQESWPVDIRFHSPATVDATIAKFQNIITWCRAEAPNLKIGFYDNFPTGFNMAQYGDAAATTLWQTANAYLAPVASRVDYIFPRVYATTDDLTTWQRYAELQIGAARTYGKPVIAFLSFQFQAGPSMNAYVPDALFRSMLDSLRRLSDGAVIWGSDTAWNPNVGWFTQTQQFINDVPIAPAAPTNLLATPRADAIDLNWTDTANNESSVLLQRSSDGVNFSTIAVLAKDTTAYTDPTTLGGQSLTYRVQASNGWGSSPYSNAAQTVSRRGALQKIAASSWSGSSGLISSGGGFTDLDGNDWAKYSSLDFGSRADTFNINVAVSPDWAGQKVELRLDSLSNAPVATLTLTSTGSWTTYANQSLVLSAISGVHDLYLVGRGTTGVANVAEFSFANTGATPPAYSGTTYIAGAFDSTSGAYRSGTYVRGFDGGDWLLYKGVDLGTGVGNASFDLGVLTGYAGQKIEVRLDSPTAPAVATLTTASTGSWNTFATQAVNFTTAASGRHDVYLVGVGSGAIADLRGFKFAPGSVVAPPTVPPTNGTLTVNAANYTASSGIYRDGIGFGSLDNGDYALYPNLDFGTAGMDTFAASLALPNGYAGQQIEVRLDSLANAPVGVLTTTGTGSWTAYTTQTIAIDKTTGVHSVYLVGKGSTGIANVAQFTLSATGAVRTYTGAQIPAPAYTSATGVYVSGTAVSGFDAGDSLVYKAVNFGTGVNSVSFSLAVPNGYAGQKIEVRLDSPTAPAVGTLTTASTGSWTTFATQTASIAATTGTHDVYLVAVGYGAVADLRQITLNPMPVAQSFNAATFASSSGIYRDGTGFAGFDNGDWAMYSNVDFGGAGLDTFTASLAVPDNLAGQQIEVRLDSLTNAPIGTLITTGTGSWTTYSDKSVAIAKTTGVHNVYLVAKGSVGIANVAKLSFSATGAVRTYTGTQLAGSAYASASGVYRNGATVEGFDGGDWIRYQGVDFGTGVTSVSFLMSVLSGFAGKKIEIRLDSATGPTIASLTTASTGSWSTYTTQTAAVTRTTGIHDIYIVGVGTTGSAVANIQKITFTP